MVFLENALYVILCWHNDTLIAFVVTICLSFYIKLFTYWPQGDVVVILEVYHYKVHKHLMWNFS